MNNGSIAIIQKKMDKMHKDIVGLRSEVQMLRKELHKQDQQEEQKEIPPTAHNHPIKVSYTYNGNTQLYEALKLDTYTDKEEIAWFLGGLTIYEQEKNDWVTIKEGDLKGNYRNYALHSNAEFLANFGFLSEKDEKRYKS